MKNLKILAMSNMYNKLLGSMVNYLVDAGHTVSVATSDKENWLNKGSNINIIAPDEEAVDYDYILDININSSYVSPTIKLYTFVIPENPEIKIIYTLKKDGKEYILNSITAPYAGNIDNLYNVIVEHFIDVIIDLMYDVKSSETFNSTYFNNLTEIIELERQLEDLSKYYSSIEEDSIFRLSNYVRNSGDKNYYTKTIDDIKLLESDSEILLTCLLMLFNSRKSGAYKYKLYKNSKSIIKCISTNRDDDYIKINSQITSSVYNITENIFYNSNSCKEEAEISIILDAGIYENQDDSLIRVVRDMKNHKLTITYHSELYFLNEIDGYIRYMYDKLFAWKNSQQSIVSILCNSPQLYKNTSLITQGIQEISDKTLNQLFEEQVIRTPFNIALRYKDKKFTYVELNQQANILANYIRHNYIVNPDSLVALHLDRNEYMLIAILAVLKSGAAYVPIDPNFPEKRIKHILNDTQTKLLITNTKYKSVQIFKNQQALQIIYVENTNLLSSSTENPKVSLSPTNLAYIIYTSGTTGNPKGVMVEHQSVVNLVVNQGNIFNSSAVGDHRNYLFYSNYVFDAHVWEIYHVLIYGHALNMLPSELMTDIESISKYIEEHKIAVATIPPAILDTDNILKLETLIVAGETADKNILDKYIRNNTRVIVAYGPTECTVCASINEYNKDTNPRNIGLPLNNLEYYILDQDLSLLPIGAVGELYVSGISIARGYLNQKELTAKLFITNPFQRDKKVNNSILYKTGDLVRRLPNGSLEYLGRADNQVKIRGHRIELSEIENIINQYSGVKNSTVDVLLNNNNKQLIAYYVSENKLDEEQLLQYLNNSLPSHLIPDFIMHLPYLPINVSGKLDRKSLPRPQILSNKANLNLGEFEKKLCKAFSETLNLQLENIDLQSDFFKLGGNSILANKLVNKVNKIFNTTIRVSNVFVNRTPEQLANLIQNSKNEFKLINNLNNIINKPNMFMIHPGMSGSEVYLSLAHKLATNYSCYGIDNYNLNTKDKIYDLKELGNVYLNEILKIKQGNDPYLLTGWSIGGLLALQIASILEQRGYQNVLVILLDTFLMDNNLISVLDYNFEALHTFLQNKGHSEKDIIKIMDNLDCENTIVRQSYNIGRLSTTKVLLFKAMQKYDDVQVLKDYTSQTDKYLSGLLYNNLDDIIDIQSINVIPLKNVSHSNVCTEESIIYENILSWYKLNMYHNNINFSISSMWQHVVKDTLDS
ncbi:MAG: amino acid adenylation domain-containing protein [Neisseriaceae bacterium]